MLDELEHLLEMQRQDRKIERLDERLVEIPGLIAGMEAELAAKRERLTSVETEIEEAEKKKRLMERNIQDAQLKANKLDAQLMGIKTNREYRATLTEIDSIKQGNSDRETEILVLLDRLDELQTEKKEAAAEFSGFEGAALARIKEQKDRAAYLEGEKAEALKLKEAAAEKVSPQNRRRYERLLSKIGTNIVVELVGENCGGCLVSLRPQYAVNVRDAEHLYVCENCRRFLYSPPAAEESGEENTVEEPASP